MALGIRLEMMDGRPITATAALVRYIGYFVSGLILLFGFLLIGFTREKRGLHDYLARTVAGACRLRTPGRRLVAPRAGA
jgi:uncharacterized RDD family membrane protein YckC